MTAAFAAADALAQRSALTFGWRQFNDPVFLPLLRAAYTSPAGGYLGVRDIALRRLYEVAPDEGRQAMLEELARPRPRVSIGILALLPDVAFPDLEARWLQQLQSARFDTERRPAAERIERFGTATLGVPIERFYRRASNGLRCATRAALLAYMVRVEVPAAEGLLTEAATGGRWDETCRRPLITEVAELEWNAVVERATIAALAHPDAALIEAAADILAQRGSLVARGPLEQRLKTVIASIRGLAKRRGDAAARRHDHLQYVAGRVADAIDGAKSWMLTAEDRRALAALCESAHTDCDFTREDADPPHTIHVSPSVRRVDAFDVLVDYHPLRSLQDLREKLRQFPSGTRLHWSDWPTGLGNTLDRWTWSEREVLFEAFRRDAATHGVFLQRERTYRSSDKASCPSVTAGRIAVSGGAGSYGGGLRATGGATPELMLGGQLPATKSRKDDGQRISLSGRQQLFDRGVDLGSSVQQRRHLLRKLTRHVAQFGTLREHENRVAIVRVIWLALKNDGLFHIQTRATVPTLRRPNRAHDHKISSVQDLAGSRASMRAARSCVLKFQDVGSGQVWPFAQRGETSQLVVGQVDSGPAKTSMRESNS